MHLKPTYLLISIALLASSCNSDTTDDISLPRGGELSFNVSTPARGSVTTSFSQFLVYGDTRPQPFESSLPVTLFNKTIVEYNNNSWNYAGTQYWIPNYEHSFVAVAPGTFFETGNSPQYFNSQLSFEYSIPTRAGILSSNSDITDILIATHRRHYENTGFTTTTDNKITLKFGHLLSLLNIAPAFNDNSFAPDDYVLIHKLQISEIKTKAQFSIRPAQRQSNSQTDDMTIGVAPQEEGNIIIEFPTPIKIENNAKYVSLFADDDAIIMLPQEFEPESEAKIEFYYSFNEENLMRQGSISLNNLKWESGKSYSYTFTIERTSVKFDNYEINPWNTIKGEEITVD